MSRFDDTYAAAVTPLLFDWYGDPCEYVPAPGAQVQNPTPIALALISDELQEKVFDDTQMREYLQTIRYATLVTDPTKPRYCGVSDIQVKGGLTIAGVEYRILERVESSQYQTQVKLVRTPRTQLGNPNFKQDKPG